MARPKKATAGAPQSGALTRERILEGAVQLADAEGVESLTMRQLAAHLQTKPMSIYYHVPGKEAILAGMVDRIFGEIERPPVDLDWKPAMRRRCISMREVLARHPWAPPLMESRETPGPETLGHHDAVIACLKRGGLSLQMIAHAYATLDSYVYGFALQEANLPFSGGEDIGALAKEILAAWPEGHYPHLREFTREHVLQPGYSFASSFEVGLDLLLDGLAGSVA